MEKEKDRYWALKMPKNCFENPRRDIDYMIHNARCHKNFSEKFVTEVLNQNINEVENQMTVESRKLYEMARQVSVDTQRTLAFLRFKVSRHGILYSAIDLEHKTEYCILRRFAERFPLFVIILESKRGCFIAKHNEFAYNDRGQLKDVLKEFEKNLPVMEILEGMDKEDFNKQLWEEFYKTQYIPKRRNVKLMLKQMPKKFLKFTDKYENVFYRECRSLNDFFE